MEYYRYFDETSTPIERDFIRKRVYVIDQNIIIWKHLPFTSEFTLNLMSEVLLNYNNELVKKFIIVDMSEMEERMNGELRAKAKQTVNTLTNVIYLAFVFGEKRLAKVTVSFVMKLSKYKNYTIKNKFEDAIEDILKYKNMYITNWDGLNE
ncbi:MAG: hypothetical protein OEZ01_01420 [Candidatus Heimdallarchaeota archaeon]|nr:hypothetical protein [Candidatus Heimdallarchaeota archaeon]MDH5644633.1 hypothetical protein [Candidatus Heimdallarchaeota archaeon]